MPVPRPALPSLVADRLTGWWSGRTGGRILTAASWLAGPLTSPSTPDDYLALLTRCCPLRPDRRRACREPRRGHPDHPAGSSPSTPPCSRPSSSGGIALYDLEAEAVPAGRKSCGPSSAASPAWPVRRWPSSPRTASSSRCSLAPPPCPASSAHGDALRNIWAHTVIFCGHFPGDVRTFTDDQIEARPAASGTCARSRARRTSRAAPSST
jgi:hypothetical protein